MPATTASSASGRRPVTSTSAPSAANRSATALPIPWLPPVTMTFLPSNRRSSTRWTSYLTAPAAMPRTRWRWKTRYAPMTGSDVISSPAISAG